MHCTVSPPDTTVTGPFTSEGRSGVVLNQLESKVLLQRRQLLWQHRSPVHLRTGLSPSVALMPASSIACGAWEVHKMSLAGSCVQLVHTVKVPCYKRAVKGTNEEEGEMCAEIKAMPYTRIMSKIGNGFTMSPPMQ